VSAVRDPAHDQPLPVANDRPHIADLLIERINGRKAMGVAKYGTPLQSHNGRDALTDALEEALDLCHYLMQAIDERDHPDVEEHHAAVVPERTVAGGSEWWRAVCSCGFDSGINGSRASTDRQRTRHVVESLRAQVRAGVVSRAAGQTSPADSEPLAVFWGPADSGSPPETPQTALSCRSCGHSLHPGTHTSSAGCIRCTCNHGRTVVATYPT
jgi:hypothetical protein